MHKFEDFIKEVLQASSMAFVYSCKNFIFEGYSNVDDIDINDDGGVTIYFDTESVTVPVNAQKIIKDGEGWLLNYPDARLHINLV